MTLVVLCVVFSTSFTPTFANDSTIIIQRFGTYGSQNGQFQGPSDVLFVNNQYYVVESDGDRVQIFDENWNYIDQFGGTGSGLGQLESPQAIEYNGTYLFVSDVLNDRISVFDLDGDFITTVGSTGTGLGQLDVPVGIEFHKGYMYVSEYLNDRVQIFNENTLIAEGFISSSELDRPRGVRVHNGLIYVLDTLDSKILAYSADSNSYVGELGLNDTDVGGMDQPWGLEIINDKILVSDWQLDKIIISELTGEFISEVHTDWTRVEHFEIIGGNLVVPSNIGNEIFTLRGTPTPDNLNIVTGESVAQLSWTINNNEAIAPPTSYSIYRDNGTGYELLGETESKSFTDFTMTEGETYTYRIYANSFLGSSDALTSSQIETPPTSEMVDTITDTVTETTTETSNNSTGDDDEGSSGFLPIPSLPIVGTLLMIPLLKRKFSKTS